MYSHRSLTLLFGFLTWTTTLSAQTYFSRHYGEDTDNGKALVQTDDGGFMTLGSLDDGTSQATQLQLNRFNATGDLLWTKHYGSADLDLPSGMIRTKNGTLILCGTRTIPWGPPNAGDVYLICTDMAGKVLWETHFGKASGAAFISQVMETPDEALVAVGTAVPPGGDPQNFIAKLSNDGALIWEKTFGQSNKAEELYDVVMTPEGYYAMAGYITPKIDKADVVLTITDTSGQVLSTTYYASGKTDKARALLSLTGGGFLLAGDQSESGSNTRVLLIRTNPDGDTLWQRRYPIPGRYTTAYDAVEVPGQGFVMTGVIKFAPNVVGHRVYLLHVDYEGNLLWEREFEIEPPNGLQTSSAGNALIRTTDGGFAITGDWFNGVRKELILIKTNAAGIVSTRETAITPAVRLYPNPVERELVLTSEALAGAIRADFFTPAGQLVLSETFSSGQQTITLTLPKGIASGLYTLVLYDRLGSFYREQVVVSR